MITAEETQTTRMSGAQKCAVLLASIDRELAAAVMARMEKDEIERVTAAIAEPGEVLQVERERVLEEFCRLTIARKYAVQGGARYAISLLERCLPTGEAAGLIDMLERNVSKSPFGFLREADSRNLLAFIRDEHPQTIALIMSHLPVGKAAEVLAGLPRRKQPEVAKRMAKMEQTNPEVIKQVEKELESRLSAHVLTQDYRDAGDVAAVADVLNQTGQATEKTILETIEEEDRGLADRIRRQKFVFEDLILVNDKGIRSLLEAIDYAELALALRTASDELKEKIFSNASEETATLIRDEIDRMGPVRVSDVESAQQAVVAAVCGLPEAAGRGGDGGTVV